MTEPIEPAIQALRRALADAVTECDRMLYGQPGASRHARQRLPAVLERVAVRMARVQAALQARHE